MIVRCADTGLVPPARGVMVRAAALPAGFRTVNAELTEAVSTRIGLFSEVNTDLSGRRGLPKPSPGSEAAGSGEGGFRRKRLRFCRKTDEVLVVGTTLGGMLVQGGV